MPHPAQLPRREVLQLLVGGAIVAAIPGPLRGAPISPVPSGPHPTPRRGYGADKVLAADQLGGDKDLITLFDGIRKIPQVADGIRCTCGCAELPKHYSLLSCFEGKDAMAQWCTICYGIGALTVRLHARGRTLDQIREAVDARF